MKMISRVFSLLLAVVLVSSCSKKEDPEPENEEEVITTIIYTLTPQEAAARVEVLETVTLKFYDKDGDGSAEPVITGGDLAANTTYTGVLELKNEIENEDVTEEIEEENDEHQFFFQATGANVTVTYNDKDANGKPVGLETTVKTGAASNGKLKVTLKHQPNKSGDGVSDGKIANAGGETDIEVSFPVTVK